jgi:hypothetical protein
MPNTISAELVTKADRACYSNFKPKETSEGQKMYNQIRVESAPELKVTIAKGPLK